MTPDEYRRHKSPALRRAFYRGELAWQAGLGLGENPYRRVGASVRARRGSWSESFTQAWAVGWREAERRDAIHEAATVEGLTSPGGPA